MKMTPEQYDALKSDIRTLARLGNLLLTPETDISIMWALFHEVNAQRSYGDDHPRWKHRNRVLPPSHVDGSSWLHELYQSGLYDQHIRTALVKIAKES